MITSKTSRLAMAVLAGIGLGCGQSGSGNANPTPVVFEDRLVISENDDKSPLPVPPEQLPRLGECRLWHPGRPAREQGRAGSCAQIEPTAPPESWVVYRPSQDPRLVHVRVVDPEQAGRVVQVRVYDAARGTYLGSKQAVTAR